MEYLIVIFAFTFGIAGLGILMEHFQKMAKIRAEVRANAGQDVLNAIKELRTEVAELRDTTTRYDLSFDTSLQRLESRMNHLEQRVGSIEQAGNAVHAGDR